MGITGLAKLIADIAPNAIKENEIKNHFGRKIAIDASMSLYQFLIAVRSEGAQLTSSDGETTSHIMGTFYRTIRLMENGIKPVYVFDGKPPQMKSSELEKRADRRQEAQKSLAKAEEAGDATGIDKFSKRLVKVTSTHTTECKELLKLMGVPFIEAPCEAEAQCAAMVKAGKVYATATEDMDALTFGSPVLLRHMTFSEARKMPIQEFQLDLVLETMEMSRDEFIDLCILLGCDYCNSIKGVGPKRAIELMRQYKSLENIIENLDTKKYQVPEDWPFKEARRLFIEPEITDPESIDLKWIEPDEEGLVKFLCGNRGFNEDRVRNGAKKLIKARSGTTQGRLDSFFSFSSTPNKRKAEEAKAAAEASKKTKKGNYSKRDNLWNLFGANNLPSHIFNLNDSPLDIQYMSDSEAETASMETTRMYKDDLELSRMSLYLSSHDLIHNSPETARHIRPESITFESTPGDISVDFVLVSSSKAKAPVDIDGWNRRSAFEERIKEQGLLLEEDVVGGLTFVKVHAPIPVLRRYCEILKLRMPMKEYPMTEHIPEKGFDLIEKIKKNVGRFIRVFITIDPGPFAPTKYILTAEYSREKSYLFNEDDPEFFSAEVRTLVIDFILNRVSWGKDQADGNCVGIQCLLDGGVYRAAYPLHDGEHTTENSLRHELYVEWAMMSKWIRKQPIDQIKEYLGVKYAFYFTWLGFYTHLLIPAAILGLIVFFYGIFTFPNNRFSSDICNATDTIMCPLCDRTCDYWELSNTCFYARLTYLFDNDLTVIFAFLMSIWATLFLELWKRYSATITHRWGLTGFTFEAEHPRPQYLARLSGSNHTKVNIVTGNVEPTVPLWKKIPATLFSISILLLLIVVAIAAVFGVVLYRMSVLASLSLTNQSDWMSTYSNIFIPTTAAIINLVCIQLLNFVYDKVAIYLTEMELLRTQTEFDESLTIKIYLFQFVNYYTSIIYIAFLKGKNVGYPAKYLRIFNLRQEECSPGGCLMELSIQLFIIMVGQQALNTVVEMIIPVGLNWFNSLTENTGRLDNLKSSSEEEDLATAVKKPWIEDYKLLDWGPRGLFPEYLEMVMQYGFVTLFVTAFPLGPFFALLNNVFEMRLDAKKFLKYFRRPIPHRVPNIGVWYRVLDILGKLAVITNAFIIAFSSNYIPRMVYISLVSEDNTDKGFLNNTLAYFDTKDFENGIAPLSSSYTNVTYCRYKDYRNPPWSPQKYERPTFYYEVLVARLTFVVIFQNIVSLVKVAVQWLIPDVPNALSDRIKRESYLTTQMIIKNEAKKAAGIKEKVL